MAKVAFTHSFKDQKIYHYKNTLEEDINYLLEIMSKLLEISNDEITSSENIVKWTHIEPLTDIKSALIYFIGRFFYIFSSG